MQKPANPGKVADHKQGRRHQVDYGWKQNPNGTSDEMQEDSEVNGGGGYADWGAGINAFERKVDGRGVEVCDDGK